MRVSLPSKIPTFRMKNSHPTTKIDFIFTFHSPSLNLFWRSQIPQWPTEQPYRHDQSITPFQTLHPYNPTPYNYPSPPFILFFPHPRYTVYNSNNSLYICHQILKNPSNTPAARPLMTRGTHFGTTICINNGNNNSPRFSPSSRAILHNAQMFEFPIKAARRTRIIIWHIDIYMGTRRWNCFGGGRD